MIDGYEKKNLHVTSSLQGSTSVFSPGHAFPPHDGAGSLQCKL